MSSYHIYTDDDTLAAIQKYGQNSEDDWFQPLGTRQYDRLKHLPVGTIVDHIHNRVFKEKVEIVDMCVNKFKEIISLYGLPKVPPCYLGAFIRVRRIKSHTRQ